MAMAGCGLSAAEVAVFPVRYAVDESPHKGAHQGPNPLPRGWSSTPPALKTRSYTLRQLRDGWLYVWDSTDQTLHEYAVSAHQFTRHLWTDTQVGQDIRHNPGDTHPYLLYPRRSRLHLAYSPVQWTWRLCEHLRSNAPARSQWMREVDLPAYCQSGSLGHGGPITDLGASVSDILVEGACAPTFSSTLLPTEVAAENAPFKAAFEECLVRGHVPDQDTALFVALDDPLAIIDDLSMNLAGRQQELDRFESLHQHRLQSAAAVMTLCGLETDELIPPSITDAAGRQAYVDDLYELLRPQDEIERAKDLVTADEYAVASMAATAAFKTAQSLFHAKRGHLPDPQKWQIAFDRWNSRRLWREDVHFEDVRKYFGQRSLEAQRLQEHCTRSELDLITWLDRLSPQADEIYHDTADEAQACSLMRTAQAVYTLLALGHEGQQWLCKQAQQPSSLLGLARLNFNPEVERLLKHVAHNFSTTGYLDDQGHQGDGSAALFNPGASGDATSFATRSSEVAAVLDLESVKNSQLYRALSEDGKASFATLIKIANNHVKSEWHALGTFLLPGLKGEAALAFALQQALISTEISTTTQLRLNPSYTRDYKAWQMTLLSLTKQITAAERVLSRPAPVHDQRSARAALHALDQKVKALFLNQPRKIVARASGSSRLMVDPATLNSWLGDLGQVEVAAQLNSVGTPAHGVRARQWLNQHLGSALPGLLVALNMWNVQNTYRQAQNNGRFTADELRSLGANAGYAANAIAALWVGPAWHRAGEMSASLSGKTLKVAEAGYREWLSAARTASKDGVGVALANEFATVSKALIWKTATWTALGAVATALEAWQIHEDLDAVTSSEENFFLSAKLGIVVAMFFLASLQFGSSVFGVIRGFAWVMSPPAIIAIAVLGVAYLLTGMIANYYKREGLRLWLYRCTWGRGSIAEWTESQGHADEMQSLLNILMEPSVFGKASVYGGERTPKKWLGHWIQIQFPAVLEGQSVALQSALLGRTLRNQEGSTTGSINFHDQLLGGNWVDPELLGKLPASRNKNYNQAYFNYSKNHQYRLWQVWVESASPNPILNLKIEYIADAKNKTNHQRYIFQLTLDEFTNQAELVDSFEHENSKSKLSVEIRSIANLKIAIAQAK